MRLRETPTQTVGPFFAIMLEWPDGDHAVADGTEGAIWLRGQLFDGAGGPVPDGLIELWQAGRDPRFARCRTDPNVRRPLPATSAHGLPSRATLDPTGDDERLQVLGSDPHMPAELHVGDPPLRD